MKLVGAAWVAVFLLYELTSSVGPLWVVCVEIVFLMWLCQYVTGLMCSPLAGNF